jgi:sialic acid synthase SpsE
LKQVTAMSFKIGDFDTARLVMIVAEIGNNHEGDFGSACELVDSAIESGVNAVKFQTIVPERLVMASETDRIAQLRRFSFSIDQFKQLAERAKKRGAMFFSTPFDLQTVSDLEPFVPAFKIASGDNDWPQFLQTVARTGKPIVLSTGILDLAGVRRAVDTLTQTWADAKLGHPGLCVLHCVSAYPCPEGEANLQAIRTIASLGVTVGYSDHTLGVDAAVYSVLLGARLIEKHFTLSHNQSAFRDHALSADPAQMTELVRRVRAAERLMGDGVKRVMASEQGSLVGARRGVAVTTDLPARHLLADNDMIWLRPRKDLNPADQRIAGRRLRVSKAAGAALAAADLTD